MTEWQLGINAFQEGRLREASDRLRATAADHERTISQQTGLQTHAYLGAALYALGDAAGAADAFAKAVSLRVDKKPPVDLLINLANAYIASGQRQQAESTLLETLRFYPGTMEATMLLERLKSRDQNLPLTGAIFGESPDSVKRYMDTLSFSTVAHGFSPDQVRSALTQIHHYIDTLAAHLANRDETIADKVSEIERLRQAEETLVENMLQARQETDRLRHVLDSRLADISPNEDGDEVAVGKDNSPPLTPLEILFQKKI